MCSIGSWRSFATIHVKQNEFILQQCPECNSHRAIPIDDVRVVTGQAPSDTDQSNEKSDDEDQDETVSGVDLDDHKSW